MRLRAGLFAAAGAAILVWLVAQAGPGRIERAVASVGWGGFALVVASQVALAAVAAAAWTVLGARSTGVGFAGFLRARLVREAVGQTLPFTQLGGIAVGARALVLEGAPGRHAVAATLSDVTLEFASQVAYAAIGAVVLERLRPGHAVAGPVSAVLCILAAMAGAMLIALRVGAPGIERLIQRLSRRGGGQGLPVSDALATLRRRPASAVVAGGVHLAGWCLTAIQTWLILRLLGARVGPGAAVVIDSLTSAARAAAFVAPAGLGVQEGALVLLCALFGIGAPAALALSLLRRGRDLTLAAPVLTAWQLRHGERIWRVGPGRASLPGRKASPP